MKKDEGRKVRGTSRQEEPDIAVGRGGPATGRFVSNCSRVSRENTDVQNVLEVEVGETDGEGKGNESWLCTGECRAGPWGPGGDRWAVGLSGGARQCEGAGDPPSPTWQGQWGGIQYRRFPSFCCSGTICLLTPLLLGLLPQPRPRKHLLTLKFQNFQGRRAGNGEAASKKNLPATVESEFPIKSRKLFLVRGFCLLSKCPLLGAAAF